MTYNFEQVIDRRSTESAKWHYYGPDVLPLWVADMDFPAPEPVIQALRERVKHGIFGYGLTPPELSETIVEHLGSLHDWQVTPDDLVFLPGVVTGFNLATQAVSSPGDRVLAQTPIYYPILYAPGNAGCSLDAMELTQRPDGQYEVDFDAFEAAINDQTRIFILCNPHNPVGRVFRRDELERMAELCLRHDVVICSDEIHCDLVFPGHEHLSIAALAPEIAERTITLIAPSKTYNIAGLSSSVAIIQNQDLRQRFLDAQIGLVPHNNILGSVAALAAYREGTEWLAEVLDYLKANRDYLQRYVDDHLPGVSMGSPEGTFLAWLDCRQAGIPGSPHTFFLEKAKVALNEGATFGKGGEGFVRLNFGCPRSTLDQALERMREALAAPQR
jgi:cystathionine beta-lyase